MHKFVNKFVNTHGIRLHYLEHAGDGPTLLLMPGLTANAHSFDGLIAAGLSPALHVLALDLRGRGLSDKPEVGYSMADHAADVLGLLDALAIESVALGGHSFGGLLTLYLAAHHPERVERLVVIDAGAELHPRAAELVGPSVARLGRTWASWEEFQGEMRALPFWRGYWDDAVKGYYRADVEETGVEGEAGVRPRSSLAAIGEAIHKGLGEDWWAHMQRITQPAILLNATDEYGPPGAPPLLPTELAQKTVDALPDCRYVHVPGNHMTMLFGEGARVMTAAIVDFVRQA